MKTLFLLPLVCLSLFLSAQKSEKPATTYTAKSNGVSHIIQVGDTIHLGYGSTPYGSFMFIVTGSPPHGMEKEAGGRSGEVTKVKYWKSTDQYELNIKVKGYGSYAVQVPQAIDKKEVIG